MDGDTLNNDTRTDEEETATSSDGDSADSGEMSSPGDTDVANDSEAGA